VYHVTLGLSSWQLRDLTLVGRALGELDAVDRAFAEERVGWSQVRLLSRICIPQTQEAWLAWAQGRSVRKLEEEVARSQKGSLPGEGLRTPRPWLRIIANVDPKTYELWERIQELFEDEKGEPGKSREVLREVFESYLERKSAIRAVEARSEAKSAEVREEQDPEEPTGERLRREVLIRDGARCGHCGSEYRVQAHHVKWRSRRGETRAENLLSLCDLCRIRHKSHYADFRIMPRRASSPPFKGVVGIEKSA